MRAGDLRVGSGAKMIFDYAKINCKCKDAKSDLTNPDFAPKK